MIEFHSPSSLSLSLSFLKKDSHKIDLFKEAMAKQVEILKFVSVGLLVLVRFCFFTLYSHFAFSWHPFLGSFSLVLSIH